MFNHMITVCPACGVTTDPRVYTCDKCWSKYRGAGGLTWDERGNTLPIERVRDAVAVFIRSGHLVTPAAAGEPATIKPRADITCPNPTCAKSNDAGAKCCWWCEGRLT